MKRILVVEDNPQNMRLVEMALSMGGYALLKAANGHDALELIQKEHPALVLMDIRLPGMDGLEVTRKVRQSAALRDIPIVATTAYAGEDDEKRSMAAGCDAYLAKPFSIRQLRQVVDGILEGKTPQ